MPKNVEDIVPPRRSIRDIPIPENRRKINLLDKDMQDRRAPADMVRPTPPPPPPQPQYQPRPAMPREEYIAPTYPVSRGKKRVTVWVASIIGLLVVGFAALSLMNGATLTYTPRTANLTFTNNIYSASKNAEQGSGKLPFSVIQLDGTKSASAPASGTEQASVKAQGTIIVYNNFSDTPQKLVATTRFQTSDGKIFRIKDGITIPGKTSGQPGSVEAAVVADQPGADYNIGLSDFTVPGLKDTPQYSSIYARSKTPMTGGFVGTRAKVSADDMTKAKSLLDGALKDELITQARAQVPSDYVIFPELSQITYGDLTTGSSTASNTVISEHANFTGVIFKKDDISAFLGAQKLDPSALVGPVTITDFSGLSTAMASSSKTDLLGATTISFQINGNAPLLWVTDEKSLASDLAGKNKNELTDVLKNFPSIESASAMIRPFWKSTFPSDAGKIKIEANATK